MLEKLILTHKELLLLHEELEKSNAKLVIANLRLNKKLQKQQQLAITLQDANGVLISEKKIEDKSSRLLELANATLEKATLIQYENKLDLDKIMHILSHKTRKAVANILGISNLLLEHKDFTPAEFGEMMSIIINSAKSLNLFTEEISLSIHKKRKF